MNWIVKRVRGLTSEHALLILFMVISLFMVYNSYDYTYEAGIFTRLSGLVVLLSGLLLLVRNFLPESIRILVEDDSAVVHHQDLDIIGEIEDESGKMTDNKKYDYKRGVPDVVLSNGPLVTAIITLGYLVIGYLVGLFWVTPAFVYIYGRWAGIPRVRLAILVVIAMLITYPFIGIMDLRLDRGIWTQGLI